jgi:hypothetical protein
VIRIPAALWSRLHAHLLVVSDERFAYLLAHAAVWTDPWGRHTTDLLVRSALPVPDEGLVTQTPVRVEVDPALTRAVLRECYETGLSLIDVHTHPFSGTRVAFSAHDLDNMAETHAEFTDTVPQDPPALAASLVLGRAAVAGMWGGPDGGRPRPIDAVYLLGDTIHRLELSR